MQRSDWTEAWEAGFQTSIVHCSLLGDLGPVVVSVSPTFWIGVMRKCRGRGAALYAILSLLEEGWDKNRLISVPVLRVKGIPNK